MDTTDLSLVTLLQLPDAGALTGSEYVHLVQGADPPADVKCTLNYLGASIGTGLIYVTGLSNQYPSMAIGQLVSWPMAWRGTVCGYEAGRAGSRPTPTFSKCRRSRPISSRRARPGN